MLARWWATRYEQYTIFVRQLHQHIAYSLAADHALRLRSRLRLSDSTARSRDRDVPGFVYAIVGGEVALFSIFVIPLVVFQTSYDRWETYWWSEVVYCTLSLTSKVFLNGMMLAYVFI